MRLRSWKTAAMAAALTGFACLGTAETSQARGTMAVKRFLLGKLDGITNEFIATGARGTQNAYRDNVILFVFSEPVAKENDTNGWAFNSVDNRTIKIGIPTSGGLFIDAEGRYDQHRSYKLDLSNPDDPQTRLKKFYRNHVLFDPTRKNDPNPLNKTPFGFELNASYSVTVPGLDRGTTKVVRSIEGAYSERTFTTTFKTSDKYIQDYVQPKLDPLKGIQANDAPGLPLDGRQNVDSRADIIAFFTEPMLPSTFDVNSTFRVFNVAQNRYVSGSIRAAPDGLSFTFRPAFGYGRGPYDMRVTLTTALTDRSGNILEKAVVVNFRTELDLYAPNYNELVEGFDSTTFADFLYTHTYDQATWNGWIGPTSTATNNTNQNLSSLAGVFGAKSIDINRAGSNQNGYASPWWQVAVHCQNLYSPSMIGSTAKTVSGYAWRHYINSGRATATTHTVAIQLGHNSAGSLNATYASFSDTPVTVFTGSYAPSTNDIEWINGGKFSTNWAYNGKDHVVLDHNQTSGGGINYWRYTLGQGGNTMVDNLNGATVLTWFHDVRFYYLVDKSEAQSLWYDTNQINPLWLDPIVTQTLPPGTVATILFQGGHENPALPNTVDPTTISAWTTDPFTNLPGFRYIHFHVDFTSNLASSTKPIIDEIKMPYIFY